MTIKLFSIYDSKAEAWLPPIGYDTTGYALREFTDAANNPNGKIGKHPADYTLFQIGEFNQWTGETKLLDAKVNLGVALQYVTQITVPASSISE